MVKILGKNTWQILLGKFYFSLDKINNDTCYYLLIPYMVNYYYIKYLIYFI